MVMEMEPIEALSFILYALKKRDEDLLYQRWIIGGFHFNISFNDFKLQLMPKVDKPDAEILADVKAILDEFAVERGESYGNI